jgi:hypothetical protein
MHLPFMQAIIVNLDVLLSIAVSAAFFRPSLRKKYPWMLSYLSVRAITAVIIDFLLYGPLLASPAAYTKIHFVVYYASFLITSVLLFMGCMDVYRQAMAPLPGLVRMGTTVFRWAAFASILVTATTLTSITPGPGMVVNICFQLMRCVGTAELCLLAFLLLSMKAIGMSPQSRPFGIALGMGVMATSDCGQSIATVFQLPMNPTVQVFFEAIYLVSLGLWFAYAVLPEPARKAVTVRADSTIYKWDQIASALGHKGTQVALPSTAPSFFLVDVEKVVERAFTRTLKSKESES